MIKVAAPIIASVALAGCGPLASGNTEKRNALTLQVQSQHSEIRRLNNEITRLNKQIAIEDAVNSASVRARIEPPTKPSAIPSAVEIEEPAERAALKMCYKDYCPCSPPQGGPDQFLCDQLEAGIEPDVQTMINGRGMRDARRQIAEAGY